MRGAQATGWEGPISAELPGYRPGDKTPTKSNSGQERFYLADTFVSPVIAEGSHPAGTGSRYYGGRWSLSASKAHA